MTNWLEKLEIVDCPSDDRLADCYKFAFSPVKLFAKLDLANGHTVYARIRRLEHEDGSGHTHNIEGMVMSETLDGEVIETHKRWAVGGFVNTTTRKGYLWMAEDRAALSQLI